MGKGEIVSHIADGQYNVKILYDTTARDAAIARINAQIAELDELIRQLTVMIECQP